VSAESIANSRKVFVTGRTNLEALFINNPDISIAKRITRKLIFLNFLSLVFFKNFLVKKTDKKITRNINPNNIPAINPTARCSKYFNKKPS
jgi:hypothetical protein